MRCAGLSPPRASYGFALTAPRILWTSRSVAYAAHRAWCSVWLATDRLSHCGGHAASQPLSRAGIAPSCHSRSVYLVFNPTSYSIRLRHAANARRADQPRAPSTALQTVKAGSVGTLGTPIFDINALPGPVEHPSFERAARPARAQRALRRARANVYFGQPGTLRANGSGPNH